MKFRLTEDMRKKIWLYVIVIAIGISIYFAFDKIDFIIRSLRRVCSLTTPFILGFAIAFLLNKPMELIEVKLLGRLRMKPQHKRSIAAVLAVLLGIIIVCAFLALLLPQLFDSIFSLVKAFPGYVEDFQKFALDFVEKYAIDTQQVTNYITDTDFFEKLTGFVTDALPQMAKSHLCLWKHTAEHPAEYYGWSVYADRQGTSVRLCKKNQLCTVSEGNQRVSASYGTGKR